MTHRLPFLVFMLVLALCGTVRAGDAPLLAGSISERGSRGWGVYRNAQNEHILMFIAPRDAGPDGTNAGEPAPAGQVQAMRSLGTRTPLGIAAMDDRVYLVYPPVYANSTRLMRVYSASAMPGNVGGMWIISPAGRLETRPAIQTTGDFVDLQATRDALYVLLDEEGTLRLRRLEDGGWAGVPLPEGINPRRLDLVAIGAWLVLVDRAGLAFTARVLDPETGAWSSLGDELSIGLHTKLLAGERSVGVLDWDESDLARYRVWSDDGVFTIADGVEGVPRDASYVLLDSSETLLGMRALGADDAGQAQPSAELLEFDASDLGERFRGQPVASAPVTPEEFRFLVGMMMLVMTGVLVVVILPDRTDAMRIPESCVLADPVRRLIATMLDAVLVASIVGWVYGVSASEILTLTVIVRPDNAWGVIPATMLSGFVFGTVCEWLLGYTPGKLLMGLRVARAMPDIVERPRLWSAAVRNLIKWVLPPVAALALIDPESLHRGDRSSRSLVVMPRPADPPSNEHEG